MPVKFVGTAGASGSVIVATVLVLSRFKNILKYTGDLSVMLVAPTIARKASTPAFKSKSPLLIRIGRRGETLMLLLLCFTIIASKLMLLLTPCNIKLPVSGSACIDPSANESNAFKSRLVVKCRLGKKSDSNSMLCMRVFRTSIPLARLASGIVSVAAPVVETVPFN